MIANPDLPAYRYNPFDKAITKEGYDVEQMKTNRRAAIASGERRFFTYFDAKMTGFCTFFVL